MGIHFRFKLLEVRCHDSMIPDTMILDNSAIYASLFREIMVATPVIAVPGLQLVAVQGSNTALGLRCTRYCFSSSVDGGRSFCLG